MVKTVKQFVDANTKRVFLTDYQFSHCVCLLARNIQVLKHLEDVIVTERSSVMLVCEVNLEDVDGKWFRNNSRIKPGDNLKIRQQGERESHRTRRLCYYGIEM